MSLSLSFSDVRYAALKVQLVELNQIKPYTRNPRKRTQDAIARLAASIKRYGWQQPIVVDRDFVVIIGHGRLEAAQLLGHKRVPVVVAKDLTPEKARALRLADNRLNRDSDWNMALLTQEIEELRGLDIPLEMAAFTDDDLKRIADDMDEASLEQLAGEAGGEPVGGHPDSPEEGAGGCGNGAEGAGEDSLVTFSEVLTVAQRNVINAAINLAKQRERLERRGEALFRICDFYLEEHGDA
jgi:hypothetical protein